MDYRYMYVTEIWKIHVAVGCGLGVEQLPSQHALFPTRQRPTFVTIFNDTSQVPHRPTRGHYEDFYLSHLIPSFAHSMSSFG